MSVVSARETPSAPVDLDEIDVEAVRIGARIRALRHGRRLTLVQLAAAAELSHPFLSQLERGLARPSIASLERIARALGSSQVELLADDRDGVPDGGAGCVVLAGDGARGRYGESEGRVLLAGEGRPFRPIECVGDNAHWGERWAHAEGEFVHVIEGLVELELGGVVRVLGPRDSAYSMGGTSHRWRSADGRAYRLLIVKENHR